MALPFFYIANYDEQPVIELEEEAARHIVQVLRMKEGDQLHLTNGKGILILAEISATGKKYCAVRVLETSTQPAPERKVSIAISLVKNPSRFEWFLEKATEIGVSEIIPLICSRTEKEKFRHDRLNAICISAMLQSQQVWLPVLHEPVKFENMGKWKSENGINLIAHCEEGVKSGLQHLHISTSPHLHISTSPHSHISTSPHSHISISPHSLICIGPEGDFTPDEIAQALKEGFQPVTLGNTRLRTETAGIVAASLLVNA